MMSAIILQIGKTMSETQDKEVNVDKGSSIQV